MHDWFNHLLAAGALYSNAIASGGNLASSHQGAAHVDKAIPLFEATLTKPNGCSASDPHQQRK
jgi:hypothetical protein